MRYLANQDPSPATPDSPLPTEVHLCVFDPSMFPHLPAKTCPSSKHLGVNRVPHTKFTAGFKNSAPDVGKDTV